MTEIIKEEVPVEENNEVSFYDRLVALPVISEAINQTGTIYNAVKGHNALTQYACDTGESVVKRVTTTAYNVSSPIAGMALKVAEPYVGNPVNALDQVAGQTLAKCKEKFPCITKPPSEGITIQQNMTFNSTDCEQSRYQNKKIARNVAKQLESNAAQVIERRCNLKLVGLLLVDEIGEKHIDEKMWLEILKGSLLDEKLLTQKQIHSLQKIFKGRRYE